jgi:hypothetical protein
MLRNVEGKRQFNFGGICRVSGETLEVIARGCVEVLGTSAKVDSETPGVVIHKYREAL